MRTISLLISFMLASQAGAQSRMDHTCGRDQAGAFAFSWCIDRQVDSTNPDVLYSYHGLRGTAETWANDPHGRAITQAMVDRQRDLPTVISISFGDAWLITDLGGAASMEATLIHTIMPALEAKAGFSNGQRMVLGISMGGFNAAQLALKENGVFSRAVLICPIVQTVGPFSTDAEIKAALARQPADVNSNNYLGAINWMRSTFPDPDAWNRHNILSLASSLGPQTLPIYLTAGRQDDYGFYEGAEAVANSAQTNGVPLIWHPMDGHHCVYDAPSIAGFLTP